jgi:hypothetical protein
MKKIPTIFERNEDRSRVIDKVNPGCEWVLAGEGIATRKYDGTCCLLRGGKLFKRRELRAGDVRPVNFEEVDYDAKTGKVVGWVPIGDGPEDRWHREALVRAIVPVLVMGQPVGLGLDGLEDGTYELLGPKVQGNVERRPRHVLQMHSMAKTYPTAPRDFDGLKSWLATRDIEGIVFHHSDGRMAKIKLRDFGLKRTRDSDYDQ